MPGHEKWVTEEGKVTLGMTKVVENMMKDFPEKLKSTDAAKTPAGNGLFSQGQGGTTERAEACCAMVAKGSFLRKCVRPDTQPTMTALCKVARLRRARCTKTTRAPLCCKRVAKRAPAREPKH